MIKLNIFKNKKVYLSSVLISLILITLITIFFIINLKEYIVYFYNPTEIHKKEILQNSLENNRTIRIGGVVLNDSVMYENDKVYFTITDFSKQVKVVYSGILPSLFREGQGVVATGKMSVEKCGLIFKANEILAKHDEQYLSKEEYEQLKKNYKK